MEDDHHLVLLPLHRLVGAVVPDQHLAATVLAFGDLALEVDVVEGVVLDVDGEVVPLGVGRDAAGHRPGDQDAVALEAEVPMQAAGVVLLDDEARLLGLSRLPG